MNNKKKLAALVLVLALIIGATVGGTIAWLVTETAPVVNTFTVGDIDITLTENNPALVGDKREAKMVPGAEITKDPTVTVLEGSEDCWVFVKIQEANTADYIEYAVATGWKEVETGENYKVYGYETIVEHNNPIHILEGDKVTVKDTVTKDMMEAIEADGTKAPTLTFTAYAIQSENLKIVDGENSTEVTTAAQAWAVYNESNT